MPIETRSDCDDITDPRLSSLAYHRESIYGLECSTCTVCQQPEKECLLKIVHNVLGPYISERPDLPFPKFSELCECKRLAVMISGCPAVLV